VLHRFIVLPVLTFDQISQGGGDATLVVTQSYVPTTGTKLLASIPHDNRIAGKLKHFDIIMVVTDGHDLFGDKAAMASPASEGVAFGAAGIEDVDHGEVALGIFGAEGGNAVAEAGGVESREGLSHAVHGAAEHGLDRVSDEGVFDGDNELDILHILFKPATNAEAEGVEVLEDDGAFGFGVKSKNGVAAESLHGDTELAASFARHEVAMKGFAAEGSGDSAVGADEPEIEAKLPGDGEGKGVAASSDEDDFDTGGVGVAKGGEVGAGDFELGIEEGAVDVGGDQADGRGFQASGLGLCQGTASFDHVFIVTYDVLTYERTVRAAAAMRS
jgi:hypothetical protein